MLRRRVPSFALARIACLAALAGAAPGASATMYKCLVEDGKVFYQDAPCAPGRELRDFDKDPANVSVVPFEQPTPSSPPKPPAASRATKGRASAASRATSAARVPKPASRPARSAPERVNAAQRKFLRAGMSEAEVVARVGPPDMTSHSGRKGARWTYMPVPEDAHTMTSLQFENGQLIDVERKVLR